MRKRKNYLISFFQRLYITWGAFVSNDLFTYASAGAYSFLLSSLPILLMVLVIVVRILHTSPWLVESLMAGNTLIAGSIDLNPFILSVTAIKSVGVFEIVLGLSIFWMARRFFASIQQSMIVIYRKRGKTKPIKENLVVIAGEVLLLIAISATVTFFIAGNTLVKTALSQKLIPPFMLELLQNLFSLVPIGILFAFLFLVYLFTPRTRPRARVSFFTALACTLSYTVIQSLLGSFIDMTKYNLAYGIMSNVIVILLDVYVFFFLFLFFAQYQYVTQFFESYLLARLYLLPPYDDPSPFMQLERILFAAPPHFTDRYQIVKRSGDVIFSIGEDTTELYYVCRGIVRITMPAQVVEMGPGSIFGEFSSFIGGNRTGTARAETDCLLLKMPDTLFQETIEVDGAMSRRTLRMIADYVRKNSKNPLPDYPEV